MTIYRLKCSGAWSARCGVASALIALACCLYPVRIFAATSNEAGICPARIITSQSIKETHDGWSAVLGKVQHLLVAVMVFDGPPSDNVAVEYDKDTPTSDGGDVFTYLLDAQRQYSIRCAYFATSVELERSLPSHVTKCEIMVTRQAVRGAECH